LQPQSFRINAEHFHQFQGHIEHLFSLQITVQVMTVTDVSPGDQHAISAKLEGLQEKTMVYSPRTHDTNDPNIGRILYPTHPSQIRGCVSTPVAGKCHNLWTKSITH
jgi:hypothetical protein